MATEKIVERVRKLLELSHSDNEHEAAQAAARAAELMSEHAVTEAMLEVVRDDDVPHVAERIVQDHLPEQTERRVAWRDRVASALAIALDCETYYTSKKLHAMGRESAVQTWQYTAQYLFSEIARLADEAWLREGADLAAVGQLPRAWKGAFRLGAADVVASRLYQQKHDREQSEQSQAKQLAEASVGHNPNEYALVLVRTGEALEVVRRDRAEVKAKFDKMTEGWKSVRSIGAARGRSGYSTGREAGKNVNISSGARGALKA